MWTTIVQADARGLIEISHRIHAKDALQVLQNLGVVRPELTSIKELAQLALYLESTFTVTDPSGQLTLPQLIGSELEGNFVFIYQELVSNLKPNEYSYQSSGLMEVHSDQVNYVQIHLHNSIQTLEFRATRTPTAL
ncbi:MAG TPA: hypothetical protein EYF99_16210 [Pseudomonadales bacterium]|nr:hypothetical protein [Pseudomonadales bacterium]